MYTIFICRYLFVFSHLPHPGPSNRSKLSHTCACVCVGEPERVKWSERVNEIETSILVFVFIFVRSAHDLYFQFWTNKFRIPKIYQTEQPLLLLLSKAIQFKTTVQRQTLLYRSCNISFSSLLARSFVAEHYGSTTFSNENISISVQTLAHGLHRKSFPHENS